MLILSEYAVGPREKWGDGVQGVQRWEAFELDIIERGLLLNRRDMEGDSIPSEQRYRNR